MDFDNNKEDMTFTEAAIEVLRREGKPLHFKKIAEIAIRDSLLDHVGKIPEDVMGGQLATHCRLPHADRKVMAVQPGTFALVEWGLDEDPKGLEDIIEQPPEGEIPYRARERHPTPSREIARSTGRGEARARRREEGEERRSRRYPPPAEVAYEILAGSDRPLAIAEIAAQGAERFLMPDAFVRDSAALAAALAEDNRRRQSAGRKPLFAIEGDQVALAAQPEPGERAAVPLAVPRPAASAGDLRRSALLALRRRLRECDAATIEHVVVKLLEAMSIHDLKVAKRGRDHVVYTGRRRMGLADVRHCIRILRGGGEPGRRDVGEVRRDVGNYGAQIGVVVSAGEAGREARGESTAAGQLPVLLVCGDALAEALTEHAVGCRPIVVPEVDEAFFKSASEAASLEEAARRARREDRDRRESRREPKPEPAPAPPPTGSGALEATEGQAAASAEGAQASQPTATPPPAGVPAAEPAEPAAAAGGEDEADEADEADEGDDGEAEGAEAAEGAVSQAGASPEGERTAEGRRRRRRRRRRGGRGRGREGEPTPRGGEVGAVSAGPPVAETPAPPSGTGGASGSSTAPESGGAPFAPPEAQGGDS
jgi:ribonuclease E